MYKYILFDLDGTITDTKPGICKSVQYALSKFGIIENDIESLTRFIGPPLRVSFPEFYGFSENDTELAVKYYRERYSVTGLFECDVYEGIEDLLKSLKEAGLTILIASSKPTTFINRILEHFNLDKYFDVVVGSQLDGTRDSKIEVIKECLNILSRTQAVEISECVMIGDRKFDIDAANELNMPNIGVTYGFGSRDELTEHNAGAICDSAYEIKELLLGR